MFNKNRKLPIYLVITYPRCGSSYLCYLLSRHLKILDYHESLMLNHSFGYPGTKEIIKTHFKGNNNYSISYNKIAKIPVEQLFNDTFWPDGKYVVGCKMFWELRHHGPINSARLTAYYWIRNFIYIVSNYRDRLRIIYLNRNHKLRQYLSFKYAMQYGNWNYLSNIKPEKKIKFDQEDFINFLKSPICSGYKPKFIEILLSGLPSIPLDYTDILGKERTLTTINKVYKFLGLKPIKLNFDKLKFKKQHNDKLFNLVSNPEEMKSFLKSNEKYKKFIFDER